MLIRYTAKAQKEIRKIGPDRNKILSKIEQYADNPESLANNASTLKGSEGYRLRVGQYRVLFSVSEDESTMTVTAVRHRREAYD